MSNSNVSDNTDQNLSNIEDFMLTPSFSVKSRILDAASKPLEELSEIFDLETDSPDSWSNGPWDQGHWANRK